MSHLPTYGAPPPSLHPPAHPHPGRTPGVAGVTIRAMTHADVGRVASIETASHPLDAWSADAFGEAVAGLRTYLCRVALDARNEIVGYVVVSLAADQSDLQNLTVRADWRRRGLGRRLLDDVLSAAAERGAREVFLEVRHDNLHAEALYRSYGFTVVGRRRDYYARGIDAVLMRAPLRPPAPGAP